jgi:hypothetical protein
VTQSIDIVRHLASWPRSLTPLRQVVERYASHGVVKRSDGAVQVAPTPWIGAEAFALILFAPADPAWIVSFGERTGTAIPDPYAEILRATNGCFAFDLSLYGLPPAMQGARPRLDRTTLQALDLGLANRSWVREFRTHPDGLYVGGRSWSREANCGYFLAADGSIHSVLRTGEVVGTWSSLELMLSAELPIAETRALEQAPAGAWSESPSDDQASSGD